MFYFFSLCARFNCLPPTFSVHILNHNHIISSSGESPFFQIKLIGLAGLSHLKLLLSGSTVFTKRNSACR